MSCILYVLYIFTGHQVEKPMKDLIETHHVVAIKLDVQVKCSEMIRMSHNHPPSSSAICSNVFLQITKSKQQCCE